jgi:hypothetical protein
MSEVEQQIRERVQIFVDELSTLVRQAALEAVSGALGGGGPTRGRGRGRRAGAGAGAAGRGRRKGQKRTAEQLDQLVGSVRSYVQKSPGQGVEQIARDLGVPSKELVLPIRKLIGSGELRTRGQKRATKYFPGGGGGRGPGRRKKA